MNNDSTSACFEPIRLALDKAADKLSQRAPGCWDFTLSNGKLLRGTARADDEWLLMDAALPGNRKRAPARVEQLWGLLWCNAALPAGVKYALDLQNRPRLRAELPLVDEADAERIVEVCEGFRTAALHFRDKKTEGRAAEPPPNAGSGDAGGRGDLQRLCTEAGWPFVARADGRLAVELDVPDGFYQAMIDRCKRGLRAAVDLGPCASAAPACRQAAAVLLLSANAAVRMVRAAGEHADAGRSARFEIVWTSPPPAAELGHALAALSVACQLCAREVVALQDEMIATEYLAVRGWSS